MYFRFGDRRKKTTTTGMEAIWIRSKCVFSYDAKAFFGTMNYDRNYEGINQKESRMKNSKATFAR